MLAVTRERVRRNVRGKIFVYIDETSDAEVQYVANDIWEH